MESLRLYSKSRKRRASPEAELQKAVVQYLRLAGVPGLLFFSVPNEAKRSPRLANHLKAMGLLSGVSDLVIIRPGNIDAAEVLFLELKAKGKKPSKTQLAFRDAANHANCTWLSADNINEAIKILKECGFIRAVARRRSSSPLSEAA